MLTFLGNAGREKVLALFQGKAVFFRQYLTTPGAWKLLAKLAPMIGANPLKLLRTKHLLLFAKSFMERDALDPVRIQQCCYGITDSEGVFSFCAFNNLYRFPTMPVRAQF